MWRTTKLSHKAEEMHSFIAFLLLASAARVGAAVICGHASAVLQSNDELRICHELISLSDEFCVEAGSSTDFVASVIAQDRAIVREFSVAASAAALFRESGQECLAYWRAARCAGAFPLFDGALICSSTCDKLEDNGCPVSFFPVKACEQNDPSALCADVATQQRECEAQQVDAPRAPVPPPPPPPPTTSTARGATVRPQQTTTAVRRTTIPRAPVTTTRRAAASRRSLSSTVCALALIWIFC